jgi:hypothetical protein
LNETEPANASHAISNNDGIDVNLEDDDELFTENEDLERGSKGFDESVSNSLVKLLKNNEINS